MALYLGSKKKSIIKTINIGDEIVPTGTISITENGEYNVASYAKANVSVPDIPAIVDILSVNENGTYTAANDGLDGYSVVTVNIPYEDLADEIEAQAALIEEQAMQIEELLTILDSKTAGGGADTLDTCTLRIVGAMGGPDPSYPYAPDKNAEIYTIIYPCISPETGELMWRWVHPYGDYAEIEGVVVNQVIILESQVTICQSIGELINAECINTMLETTSAAAFKCTKPNDTAVITIVDGLLEG